MSWQLDPPDTTPGLITNPDKLNRYRWTGSTAELAESIRKTHLDPSDVKWAGCTPAQLADRVLGQGSADIIRLAQEVEDLGATLTDQVRTLGRDGYEAALAGSRVSVGAAIAGTPLAFRRKARAPTLGPIRILVNMGSQANVPISYVEKRAIAALALAIQIQAFRPVELWAVHCVGQRRAGFTARMVHVDSAPFDVSRAAAIIAAGSFARAYLLQHHEFGTEWPHGTNNPEAAAKMAGVFGAEPEDIYLPVIQKSDPDSMTPHEFVRAKLAQAIATATNP